MRSIRITLRTPGHITLPISYNRYLHGLLYECWRERFPGLHDMRGADGKGFRPFVFGRLEGATRADGSTKIMHLNGLVSFEVRSYVEELIEEVAIRLSTCGTARLGRHELEVANIQTNDRLLFGARMAVRMRSPVVAYSVLDNGHTTPLSPLDSAWLPIVRGNAARKACELGLEVDKQLQAIALEDGLRKQVTRFDNIMVTGWMGTLILAADPELLALLWCCGLGEKNSQGFGLFDVDDGVRL